MLYLKKPNKIIVFKPEVVVEEVKVSKEIYVKYFPKNSNISFNKLRISNIGLYSIARPYLSHYICEAIISQMKSINITITDAMANVGGMSIMFSQYFRRVNSCEIIKEHAEILQNNINVYGYDQKVKIYNEDYMKIMKEVKQDVIFFDPPWGGEDYGEKNSISLGINNVNIVSIINEMLPNAKLIVLLAPYNYNKDDILLLNGKVTILNVDKNIEKSKKVILIR